MDELIERGREFEKDAEEGKLGYIAGRFMAAIYYINLEVSGRKKKN